MRENIHDFYGRIIGSLERMQNGDVKARDKHGRLLGTYVKDLNLTKDMYGRIVSRGDTTSALIWRSNATESDKKAG